MTARLWRVALVDSCGVIAGASDAAAFRVEGDRVRSCSPQADPTGHGTTMAELLRNGCELMLAQVFTTSAITSCAVVAAAIDWAVAARAQLIHMSLGLAADREVLSAAVKRALAAGCIIVAATPARGSMTYPAAYAGVIQGTGDARCGPGELAYLGPRLFGGCATFMDPMTEMRRGGSELRSRWADRRYHS